MRGLLVERAGTVGLDWSFGLVLQFDWLFLDFGELEDYGGRWC